MERLICLAIGYICGLFQTSYIIGRLHKTDIREHGSGNAGTTNALRTFGKKAGAITLLCDCLKCVVAIWIVKALFGKDYGEILPLLSLYAAAGCILGHNFPVYLKFKGGKGIAASVGLLLAFDWRIFAVCFVVFFGLFFCNALCVFMLHQCLCGGAYLRGNFWADGKLRYGCSSYDGVVWSYGGAYAAGTVSSQGKYSPPSCGY